MQAGVEDAVVVTFEYTGAAQTWVVPDTVTVVTFDVHGAQGGLGDVTTSQPPGLGGRATATLSVTPGSTVHVFVGGKGADGNVFDMCSSAGASTAAVTAERRTSSNPAVRVVVGRRTCASAASG